MTATTPAMRPIPFHRPSITDAERRAVLEVLDSGWLTTGERTLAFEEAISARVGTRYAVAVNSATAALHLALEATGIRPDDEVIVPTYTFAACAEVVRYLSARQRLVDVAARPLEVPPRPLTPARSIHIRNTPNFGGGIGALKDAESASASTSRVRAGSMIPSSQSRAVE